MSLKPLADRVLIKPDAVEQKTASGLYIASSAQEKPQRGTVVAVGAGKMNDRVDLPGFLFVLKQSIRSHRKLFRLGGLLPLHRKPSCPLSPDQVRQFCISLTILLPGSLK